MEQIESYEISFTIKELKLAVKFPCKLTFQHLGKPISQQIPSNPSNIFVVNKDITLKEDRPKDYLEIAINLTTQKGGNIMAGIIRMALKDISSSEGQLLTVALQKCLDPSSTCTILLRSVRINRSRAKNINIVDDKRLRPSNDRFETKSQSPFLDARDIKPRPKYNQAEAFVSKRDRLAVPTSFAKEKAFSTVGYKPLKESSFEKEDFGSRFKHLNKRGDHQDSKTVVPGKWRDPEQVLKNTMEANEKSLKLEIVKFKTKFEESERSVQQKNKQIKILKDLISDLKRELNDKHFLQEQVTTKSNQISKLQQSGKALSKQLQEQRNRIIDLEREVQQQKGRSVTQLGRARQQFDRKEYEHQKNIYDRKEEIKELQEENQYKVNQISKMKILIEDLEKNMEIKIYELERSYNNQKNDHSKTKSIFQNKINQLTAQIENQDSNSHEIANHLAVTEDEITKLHKKIRQLEQALSQCEKTAETERISKQSVLEQKKQLLKIQEDLNNKLKSSQKDMANRQKELAETTAQLNQLANTNKKKINEMMEKNKASVTKIQQLESKINLMATVEEKLRRNIELAQRDNKNLQENEKILSKNLKIKDERILQIEKELSDLDNSFSLKDTLGRKDMDYKAMQIEKMSARLAELQKDYETQKEINEQKRIEVLRAENRIKTVEETNVKVNDQLKEAKANSAKREEELLLNIKQLEEEIKAAEGRQAAAHKEIHKLQVDKTNLKNQIGKFEKLVAAHKDKHDRLKNKEAELEATIKNMGKELQLKHEELLEMEGNYKNMENDFKLLQADKFKHEKITTIISEEKDLAKNDINKLKKEVEKRDQKEEQYLTDVKALKEQITKLEMKNAFLTKEYDKFKASLTESVKSAISVKQNYFPTVENISHMEGSKILQRSRFTRNPGSASDVSLNLSGASEIKLGEAIEGVAKEAQITIASLNQELKKAKKQKQSIERQFGAVVIRSKQVEAEHMQTIKEISNEIQSLVARSAAESDQYEQKISMLERQNGKKQKTIKQLMTEVQELNFTQESQRSTHSIALSDLLSKIDSLKYRLAESERKDEINQTNVIHLQERIIQLEQERQELEHQIEVYVQQITKKEKALSLKFHQIEELKQEFDSLKKSKTELAGDLFAAQQNLAVEKENNKNLIKEIKEQQNKNSQIKTFQSELLKEKEALIKKDYDKNDKIDRLEETVQCLTAELTAKHEEVIKKAGNVTECKQNLKSLQANIINLQYSLSEAKSSLEKQRQKIKQRQRKLIAKDAQIESLNGQIKKITTRLENQVNALNEENEAVHAQLNKQRERLTTNINELQMQLKKSKENERKLNEDNIALEESIYFEKQNNALSTSKVEQLNQQINTLQYQISKLQQQIRTLNEQIREKQEALFSMSGKLYASDNRVESRQEQYKHKLQEVEMGWRYKIEEICQQYENKLEATQKEKNYVRTGLNQYNESAEKLKSEKNGLKADYEREKEIWEGKIKKIEEEKLAALIDKNKQIQKLRQIIQQLQEKISRKDQDFKTLEDDKKKSEQKTKELRIDVQRGEEKIKLAQRNLQKEVDQMKRKQGQLKRFKDALKNNQWTIQRELKKSVQSCTKSINNICEEEGKPKVLELMRNLETTVMKLACFNIDEL